MKEKCKDSDSTDIKREDFLNDERVVKCLARLKKHFDPVTNPLIVSDVIDNEGNQYVDLVQKGGGVLGVALVGYTYILEQMGIRFLQLAGTSAGAINTAMMAIIGEKKDTKSEEIVDLISKLDFFKLVDGHPIARALIKKFIINDGFVKKIQNWIKLFFGIFGFLILSNIALLGLEKKYDWLHYYTIASFVFTGFYLVLILITVFFVMSLLKRLKNAGFGINPGDYFYDWLKCSMIKFGVTNVTELRSKAERIPKLTMRAYRLEETDSLKGSVTFIASELVTQNKIQFPEMCGLFRPGNKIDTLEPAGFVRASMSIPIFFESYFIDSIPINDPEVISAWDKYFRIKPTPTTRFVDGGMLSNFPINIFFNPKISIPRLPTFGIDLDDSSPENKSIEPTSWTLGGYLVRLLNTIRYYYDKDFLLKNKLFEKGIGKVKLSKFNWLNFFMKKEEKIEMFAIGAETATEFLINFRWQDYKDNREIISKVINNSINIQDTTKN